MNALWLTSEVSNTDEENLRGDSLKTLDGAGKIVRDWCEEQGFKVKVSSLCESTDGSRCCLLILW